MQVAILSDIHGNRHAFEAVLARRRADRRARAVVPGRPRRLRRRPQRLLRARARARRGRAWPATTTWRSRGELPLDEFSRGAALAARWTQEVIDDEHRDCLRSLSPQGAEDGIGLYHASPRDPVWEYVLSTLLAELCLDAADERVCLVGHSHVALSFVRPEGEAATGEPRRARRRGSTWPPASGSSTRAASASPATATRAPPGCCSTPTRGPPSGGASSTTSRARRRRSAPRGCPTPSPSAWSTVSERCAALLPYLRGRRARRGRGRARRRAAATAAACIPASSADDLSADLDDVEQRGRRRRLRRPPRRRCSQARGALVEPARAGRRPARARALRAGVENLEADRAASSARQQAEPDGRPCRRPTETDDGDDADRDDRHRDDADRHDTDRRRPPRRRRPTRSRRRPRRRRRPPADTSGGVHARRGRRR